MENENAFDSHVPEGPYSKTICHKRFLSDLKTQWSFQGPVLFCNNLETQTQMENVSQIVFVTLTCFGTGVFYQINMSQFADLNFLSNSLSFTKHMRIYILQEVNLKITQLKRMSKILACLCTAKLSITDHSKSQTTRHSLQSLSTVPSNHCRKTKVMFVE